MGLDRDGGPLLPAGVASAAVTGGRGDVPAAAGELDDGRGCLGGGDGGLRDGSGGGGDGDCVLAGLGVVVVGTSEGVELELRPIGSLAVGFGEAPFLLRWRLLRVAVAGVGGLEAEETSEPFRRFPHFTVLCELVKLE